MEKTKILIVFGTRPEAIKMAPVIREFKKYPVYFETKVCVTAQHREMLDQVLKFFEIEPDYDLNLMKPNQSLAELSSSIMMGITTVLNEYQPEYVYVHGDTTTTLTAALGAFYSGAKVCHVEAGLRTYDKNAPFPEEINRQLTSRIAEYHFAPTIHAKENLLEEGISKDKIIVTGNTVIDALKLTVNKLDSFTTDEIDDLKMKLDPSKKWVLVTGHRRENYGEGFQQMCEALTEIAKNTEIQIVYPVHLNPNVHNIVHKLLGNKERIHLIEPLSYEAFVWLMNKSCLIITDSGGIQEEAPSLGKPVLVMRETTERPEAIEAGTVLLVGTQKNKISQACLSLIEDEIKYKQMSQLNNPFGIGGSAEKIVSFQKEMSE